MGTTRDLQQVADVLVVVDAVHVFSEIFGTAVAPPLCSSVLSFVLFHSPGPIRDQSFVFLEFFSILL